MNRTITPFDRGVIDRPVIERFEAVASNRGSAPAVHDGDGAMSYRELSERIARFTADLDASVPPRAPVAIDLPTSRDYVAAMLAALATDRAYIPIDRSYPAARNAAILEQAGASHVFRQAPDGSVRLARQPSAADVAHLPDTPPGSGAAAYIVYTSGSTGEPKGVWQHQRGLLHDVWQYVDFIGIDTADTLSMLYSPSVIGSVRDIFGSLLTGAQLVMLDLRRDGLRRTLEHLEPVTVVHGMPPVLRTLAREAGPFCPAARLIYTAGDRFDGTDLALLRSAAAPDCDIYTGIGSSECSTLYRHWIIPRDWQPENGQVPVGYPIADRFVELLDDHDEPVPPGDIGRIVVTSEFLARGYWRSESPRLTAVPGRPEFRRFDTGDFGRVRPDGLLEFHGRADRQVKVRGHRFEPAAVEHALRAEPEVADARVVIVDGAADRSVIAVIERAAVSESHDLAGELSERLRLRLPPALVPHRIVIAPALPRLPNFKIDECAVAAIANGAARPAPAADGPDSEPCDQWEMLVAETFSQVLGQPRPGRGANFFLLGGDSLSGHRAISRLEAGLGREVSPATLFAHPTVWELARELRLGDTGGGDEGGPQAKPGVSAEPVDTIPASSMQARMWFLHQYQTDLTAYHIRSAWRLAGDLDIPALRRALGAVVERHPALRTTFRMIDGEVVQVVHPPDPFELDVEPVDGDVTDQLVNNCWCRENETPFDLTRGPMLRARLLRIAADEHLLLLTHHHIAADGWSMPVFARDLTEFYNADREDRAPRLPALPTRYQDLTAWQRQRLTGARLARLEDYWVTQLRGLGTLELPQDRPRPPSPSYRGAGVPVRISADVADSFALLCRGEGATLQMGLVAAVGLILHRHSRQADFAIGVPHWGRAHPDLEEMVGLFVNTLPIRLHFDPHLTFRSLLWQVRSTAIEAYSHAELPFDRIVDAHGVARDTSRNPLVQVMVQLVDGPAPSLSELHGVTAERQTLSEDTVRLDLEFALRRSDDGSLTGTVIFATDLFDTERIERMASQVAAVVAAAADAPDDPVELLKSVDDTERSLIDRWERGKTVARPDIGVHHLFEEQVRRTPDAVALVAGDQQISYADLDARANRLASALIDRGVGPDLVAAVCLSRSVQWVVAVLAVFKAGGAYLPLDPALPQGRLHALLNLADPVLILTDSASSGWFRDVGVPVLDAEARRDAPARVAPDPVRFSPESLAYVLFTSGSTGTPKAVEVEHRLLTNLVLWHRSHPRLGMPSRTVQFASCGFDASVEEIFATFATGGSLVLMDRDTQRDSRLLLHHLRDQKVERLFVPYVALEQLAIAAAELGYPGDLRDIVSAGERLALTAPIRHMLAAIPTCRLHNHYGPTESHVVTTLQLPPEVDRWPAEAGIGRPIDNAEIRILDSAGHPCPIGVPGEVHIGGVSVARGYLKNPRETTAKFITGPTGRVYRSGDLAAWESDGTLTFHGRIDDQVKIRGFRIEPGEVAATLLEHPGVAQAAVVPAGAGSSPDRLVAYWVPHAPARTGTHTDAAELRSHLAERLPDYMVPAAFVELDALPLTDNAKLDRRALPAPFRDADGRNRTAPATEMQRHLLAVWTQVLGHDDVGITDNFFLAGGHSLSAVRLATAIENLGGGPISVAEIFRRPTIEDQALWLTKGLDSDPVADEIPRESDADSVVVLQPSGDRAPLYVVHGWGGGVAPYIPLSRALAPQRPVLGLQADPADATPPFPSVSDMAARYAEQILSRHPIGIPIHLLGFSAGGWYAHAVAAALTDRGATIGMLGVCDSGLCVRGHRSIGIVTLPLKVIERVPIHLKALFSPPANGTRRARFRHLMRSALRHARAHLLHRRNIEDLLSHAAVADPDAEDADSDFHTAALKGHQPRRLEAIVDVFAPRRHLRRLRLLWGFYARGGVRPHPLFALHTDFWEAGLADELATEVERALSNAERRPSTARP